MGLPKVAYHLAEAATWESIQRRGLLCAADLISSSGLSRVERIGLASTCRAAHVRLPTGVEIRDQRPMPPAALERCLVGMTPAEWYRLVNSQVFFWLDVDRMNRQRRACAARPQVVLVVDIEKLIARYAGRIALSPINSGNARRRPAIRGRATFVPYPSWKDSRWASEAIALGTKPRPRSHPPAELTVAGAVADVMSMMLETVHLRPSQLFMPRTTIHRPSSSIRTFIASGATPAR